MTTGSSARGGSRQPPSRCRTENTSVVRLIFLDHLPSIMGRWSFIVLRGGVIIGIKSTLIEQYRRDRCGGSLGGIRGDKQCDRDDRVWYGAEERREGAAATRDCLGKGGGPYGSSLLGLSEIDMLGFRAQESGHCLFSPAICAGRSTRIARIRKRS